MLTSLLALLSSGAVGSLIGLIGGYMNRKLDLQVKREEQTHALALMDKELEITKQEYEFKVQVAVVEGQTAEAVEGYRAMTASYDFARPEGDGWVAGISKLVRPLITLAFFLLSVYLFYSLNQKISISIISQVAVEEIYKTVIEWILFQAGISIGWWFANRQSGPSIIGRKD